MPICDRFTISLHGALPISQLWQRGLKRATTYSDHDNVICGFAVAACLSWLHTLALQLVACATHVYSMLVAKNWQLQTRTAASERSLLVVAVPTTLTQLTAFTACWESRQTAWCHRKLYSYVKCLSVIDSLFPYTALFRSPSCGNEG